MRPEHRQRPIVAKARWAALRHSGLPLILSVAILAPAAQAGEVCRARSGPERVPLVELYTSEGCSSCPPADRWLSRRVAAGGQAAHWLAFHVDYWNDLGWPDRFSSPTYSARQRERVAAAGKRTVFTPQVMVGRQLSAMWRTDGPFARTLDAARGPAQVGLAFQLDRGHGGEPLLLRVGASRIAETGTADRSTAQLWVAETRDRVFTDVRAGENAGTRLSHDRVVTRLWGPWPLAATAISQRIAPDRSTVEPPGRAWTAFVQTADGEVLQSLRLQADTCD